jgi:hypothetical protein
VQEAAREEGWTSPWDRAEQQHQKKRAGDQSAIMRAGRVGIRRLFVKAAFDRLKPTFQMQPYSEHSIDALEVQYRRVLAEGDEQYPAGFDPEELMSTAPFKADRDTLKKDLKALGIRSKLRSKRRGKRSG